jgi:outer membrane protein OmpA-like peptidoglycan-associated protein
MRGHHRTARAALAGLACLAGLLVPIPTGAQGNPLTEPPPRGADVPAEGERAEAQVTNPSATAIIRSLAPFADGNPNAPAPRRDLRDVDADGGRRVRVDYGRAVDLTVFFAYDSARLTPEALVQLEPLGRALQSPALMPYRFLLAGHTDGAGDPGYNRGLSLQRAMAVRRHLSAAYGVDPARLVVHGWGPTRLKDPARPLASVNRRVEVALIQPDRPSSRLDAPLRGFAPRLALDPDCWTGPAPGLGDDVLDATPCAARARLAVRVGPVLRDPRRRLPPDALDDFGAAPTPLAFP